MDKTALIGYDVDNPICILQKYALMDSRTFEGTRLTLLLQAGTKAIFQTIDC